MINEFVYFSMHISYKEYEMVPVHIKFIYTSIWSSQWSIFVFFGLKHDFVIVNILASLHPVLCGCYKKTTEDVHEIYRALHLFSTFFELAKIKLVLFVIL